MQLLQVTKTQVAEILDSKGSELVNNVEALLLAVKATNDFESEMARRFGGSTSEDSEHEVCEQKLHRLPDLYACFDRQLPDLSSCHVIVSGMQAGLSVLQ